MLERGEADELSAVVDSVYEAALDPNLWTEALRRVAGFVPGAVVNIFSQDAINKSATRYFSWGDDTQYTELYLDKYAAMNPTIPPLLMRSPGEVVGMYELVPHEELKRTPLYKEYMVPQGYVDAVGCLLDKSATSVALSVVIRHERHGWLDDASRRRFQLVAPHVRRAIIIGNVIDLRQVAAERFSEILEQLAAGIFLIEGTGALVHANASGRSMLNAREPVYLVGKALTLADQNVQRAVRSAVEAADGEAEAIADTGIAMPLTGRSGRHFVAHVLPLTSGTRRAAGLQSRAVAALFVREASIDLPAAINAAAQLYGLTPAETRVLRAMIEVGGIASVASILGSSKATVKRHLEHLFAKTGTQRQVELVSLITGFDGSAPSVRET